jgi:hypothetical protein
MILNKSIYFIGLLVFLAIPCLRAAQQPLNDKSDQQFVAPLGDDDDNEFIPFEDFLKQVRSAEYEHYKDTKVDGRAAFEDMKAHILGTYIDVGPVTSFVLGREYGDCIAIDKQPTVRKLRIPPSEIAQPPHNSTFGETRSVWVPGTAFKHAESPLKLGLHDRFGHAISCPPHAFPIARLTLEKLTRFRTLADFLAKLPRWVGRHDQEFKPDWESVHLHAYGDQMVNNFGGNSWLNLWNPTGDFSISQHWYAGGTGSSLQTVEGGWEVCPDRFNTNDAVLFIYWTADNYQNTGCYNHDCAGFVQVNNNWFLGGIWNEYSVAGGVQWGFELQWKLYAGNWWLFLKGPGNYEAVGYYPTSIYNGGQLSQQAQDIRYGGEVARKTGDSWPQMGSGRFASAGWEEAAFQNIIFYIPRDENGGVGVWADLETTDEALLSCYTINYVDASSGGSWGSYFFFGGPGANTCN